MARVADPEYLLSIVCMKLENPHLVHCDSRGRNMRRVKLKYLEFASSTLVGLKTLY